MKRLRKYFKKNSIPRYLILIVVFFLLSCILIRRVFSLQIIHGQEYADNFSIQTTKTRTLKSTRGNIYDRNGNVLASNELSYTVTLEDNGTYANNREKNLSLNGEIIKIIRIIEENGDSINQDFHVIINETGKFAYDVTGISLSRFKADVYGRAKIEDLKPEEASASASQMISDLKVRFGIVNESKPYTESELSQYGIPSELSQEELLKIITVRYALFTTSYAKYKPVTIATDVNESTVAAILENQNVLQGVDIAEDSIRVYTDSVYFASLLGYTGKISSDELADLRTENPDAGYSTTSIVGKSGIEKVMETTLQGTDGSEKVYVDNMGKVLGFDESSKVEPSQGNDVYLTIDKDLQIVCYKLLEQKIAGIVQANIRNIKEFEADSNTDGSAIPIPIYDVYYALVNNSVIDISHFTQEDASSTEKRIQAVFERKQQEIFQKINQELTGSDPVSYGELSKEMQGYVSYIVNELLMTKTGILSDTAIDKNDAVYKAWTQDETISLQEYLTYAASQNWIDISQITDKNTYLDSTEVYEELSTYISGYLREDTDFSKMLYKYMLLDDEITGTELCTVLYDQGILSKQDGIYESFMSGNTKAIDLMITKIGNLEITPAQLALEPCSGSVVIVNPNNGETLACVSYPGYDNNRLANNMDVAYYRRLSKDLSKPFYNKATQERTAPGSTFKPITAIAGLSEGVINDNTYIYCSGVFDRIQDKLNCWELSGHGLLSVRDGIKNSCNIFFSETAYRLGEDADGNFSNAASLDALTRYAQLFNMDQKSGIEISEASPQISDKLPIPSSIGQGTHNYTTSQLARYVATIANSGTSYNISLLDKTTDSEGNLIEDFTPEVLSTINLEQWIWKDVHKGMEGVIQNSSNLPIFKDLPVSVAGKTGTAQQSKSHSNHGLFVCYAPAEQPEIAMAVRIANGYTSTNVVYVAKDILSYYFGLQEETDILNGKASSGNVSNTRTD